MATGGGVDGAVVSTSDGVQEFTCVTCSQGNRVTEASHYCPECDQCYCKACLCDHDVIGRSGLHRWGKRSKEVARKAGSGGMCLKHPVYESSLYCEDHNDLCCFVCWSTDHKKCGKVKEIKDVAEKADLGDDIEEIKTNITAARLQLSLINNDTSFREGTARRSHASYVKQLREVKKELNDLFEKFERNADRHLQLMQRKFDNDRLFCGDIEEYLQTTERELMIPHDNQKPFGTIKRYKEELRTKLEIVGSLREPGFKESFSPIAQDKIKSVLSAVSDLITLHLDVYHQKYDFEIGGMCQLENYDFVIADIKNKRLVRVDGQMAITKTMDLEQNPIDCCTVGKTEIAVLTDKQCLKFVSIQDGLEHSRTLTLDQDHSHFSVENGQVYTAFKIQCRNNRSTCSCRIQVQCLNQEGRLVWSKRFEDESHASWRSSMPLVVHNGKIYMHEGYSELNIYDIEGNKLTSFYGHKPGFAIDSLGFVYTSGGKNINQIDKTGKNISKTFSTGLEIEDPKLLCWDKKYGRLIVSCDKRNTLYWL